MESVTTEKSWVVYKHTSPSGKCYIGITHYSDPTKRWGKDGNRYNKRTVFYQAIKKYGWNTIQHEILHENCSEKEAKRLERKYIKYYKTLGLSYNMTIGGDGHNFGKNCESTEYHTEQSRKYRKSHPNYDKIQYDKHKEKKLILAREYYRKNKDKVLAYKKTEKVRQKARERAAKWRKEHPDYMKNYMKIYNKKKNEDSSSS